MNDITPPGREQTQAESCADAFGKGGPYHRFHFRGGDSLAPGFYFRRWRLVRVSMWLLRPRLAWRTRGYGGRWT